jgi:hypothetical protein
MLIIVIGIVAVDLIVRDGTTQALTVLSSCQRTVAVVLIVPTILVNRAIAPAGHMEYAAKKAVYQPMMV